VSLVGEQDVGSAAVPAGQADELRQGWQGSAPVALQVFGPALLV